MAQQATAGMARQRAREVAAPDIAVRLAGAALLAPAWAAWSAAELLGIGPFVAYIASRTVGLPGDPGDVGNWGYWVGTVSLFVEAALVALSVSMVLAARPRTDQFSA